MEARSRYTRSPCPSTRECPLRSETGNFEQLFIQLSFVFWYFLVVFIWSQDLNQYQVFSNSLKSVRFKLIIFSKLFYIAFNTQTPHHIYQSHHFNAHHHHCHHYCDFLYFYTFLMPVKVISINKIIAINASNVFQCNIQSMKLLPKN